MDERRFDDSEPDALGALQALAISTQEQDDSKDTGRNLVISGLAMLGAAVLVGIAGRWLIKSGMAAHTDYVSRHANPRNESDIGGVLMFGGAVVLFVAAVLVIFALVSFSKVAMRWMAG